LPVGMQILARHFDEPTMFRVADAFERAGGAN
jgi:Asp-tRNA(Asn)/Glu-tRNA(Gln) amidotransferase A subunit family amidase